jgi:hypothetical protein
MVGGSGWGEVCGGFFEHTSDGKKVKGSGGCNVGLEAIDFGVSLLAGVTEDKPMKNGEEGRWRDVMMSEKERREDGRHIGKWQVGERDGI